jgi:hypothetical protein
VNAIGAYDRHADGMLSPMPGSPFVAGGLGSFATTLSQGALQLGRDGRVEGGNLTELPNSPTSLRQRPNPSASSSPGRLLVQHQSG